MGLALGDEVCFDLLLEDTVGDGWDGAVYTIFRDEVVATGTLETGFNGTEEVCLARGCYTMSVTAGDWPSEVSWNLGNLSGGAPAIEDLVVSEDGVATGKCTAAPTTTPGPSPESTTALSTFADLASSGAKVQVESHIVFDHALAISSTTKALRGDGAIFDGARRTALLWVDAAVVSLDGMTLQNGFDATSGGCLRGIRGSHIQLHRVSMVNCTASRGGGISLLQSSVVALESVFRSNLGFSNGGVVYLDAESTFTAVGCDIDSNTATIDGGVTYGAGNVTFVDSRITKNSAGNYGGVATIRPLGSLKATRTHFSENFAYGGGVAELEGAVFTAVNSSFLTNVAGGLSGGAVVLLGSEFRATSCIFQDNVALQGFGGVAIAIGGFFTATEKSLFTGNHAFGAGAVMLFNASVFFASGASFVGNHAVIEDAGVVEAFNQSSIFVEASTFVGNTAMGDGGVATVLLGSTAVAMNCTFQGNHADRGGVASVGVGDLNVAWSTFTENTASSLGDEEGGGVAWVVTGSTFRVEASRFHRNSAARNGGVVLAISESQITARSSHFYENHAEEDAGVANVVAGSSFLAEDSTFVGNSASSRTTLLGGGVAYVRKDSSMTVLDCSFERNVGLSGGVVFLNHASFDARNTSFIENRAVQVAGVVYAILISDVSIRDSLFQWNRADLYGGVGAILDASTCTTSRSKFHGNFAVGGGVFVVAAAKPGVEEQSLAILGLTDRLAKARVTVTESLFTSNSANTSGGVFFVMDMVSVSIRNSTCLDNDAESGGLVALTSGVTVELYNTTLRRNRATVVCEGTGTLIAALLDIDFSERFTFQENCIFDMFQSNRNGSSAYRDDLLRFQVLDLSSAAVSLMHWTYPCLQGQWSLDGMEHGNTSEYVDANGLTIDANDRFCDRNASTELIPACSSSCRTCPSGRYLEFTLNRYLHVGERFCSQCPVGRYLEDDGTSWWLHDEKTDCKLCPKGRMATKPGSASCLECPEGTYASETGAVSCAFSDPGFFIEDPSKVPRSCPPGRYSVGGTARCEACSPGTYQPFGEQTQCRDAEPGHFVAVEAATTSRPCAPGSYSLGGSAACLLCPKATYQPDPGAAQCVKAEPGHVVVGSGALIQEKCPSGTFSAGQTNECEKCPVGSFSSREGAASCIACPAPMTTKGTGRTYCDACDRSYFWNSLVWNSAFDQRLVVNGTAQCVDCCERCAAVCENDEDDCVRCDSDGAVLETLEVGAGFWRATKQSVTVYECPFGRAACRGGTSTKIGNQCVPGHFGALCGSCRDDFDYDVGTDQCQRCTSFGGELSRVGTLGILVVVLVLVVGILTQVGVLRRWWHRVVIAGAKVWLGDVEGAFDEDSVSTKRQKLKKSILTKLKIIIAAFQIAASTQTVFLQVRYPPIFAKLTHLVGVIGLTIFDVGSFKCLFGWTYFEKLLFVTLAPFGVLGLGAALYWCIHRRQRKKADIVATITYGSLLFIYIVLPSIATYVMTYFSCARFNRGSQQRDLRVIASALSIKCTSKRYRQWAIYAALMIAVWPVGATLGIAVVLFATRAKLNPAVALPSSDLGSNEAVRRETSRHLKAVTELKKIEARNADKSITGLEFVFEEYSPRQYMFPIFELGRRLFLTSVLAVFFPGSMHQVVVGLLGAMLSFVIYVYCEAYIENDDNIVAAVGQGELVLIYFAAWAIYTSDETDQQRDTYSGVKFDALLVIVFFASFVVAIYAILLEVIGYSNLLYLYDHGLPRRCMSWGNITTKQQRHSSRDDHPPEENPKSVELIRRTSTMNEPDAAMV